MKATPKILVCVVAVVAFTAGRVSAQSTDKNNPPKQVQTDVDKAGTTQQPANTNNERVTNTDKTKTGGTNPDTKEDKRWGLQVTTGEKWYQVSIKFVM